MKINKNLKKTIFVMFVVFVVGVGIWLFFGKSKKIVLQNIAGLVNVDIENTENPEKSDGELYTNTKFGFSFIKPEGYKVGEFTEENKKVILVQSPDAKKGFQILITPLEIEENITITKAIIKSEIPNIKIEQEEEINIDEAKGLKFKSDNEFFENNSAEIWFMHKKNLYQISSYQEMMPIIEKVINSWKFN